MILLQNTVLNTTYLCKIIKILMDCTAAEMSLEIVAEKLAALSAVVFAVVIVGVLLQPFGVVVGETQRILVFSLFPFPAAGRDFLLSSKIFLKVQVLEPQILRMLLTRIRYIDQLFHQHHQISFPPDVGKQANKCVLGMQRDWLMLWYIITSALHTDYRIIIGLKCAHVRKIGRISDQNSF